MGVPLSVMLPEDLRHIVVPFGLNAFLEQIYYEDLSIIRSSALEEEIDPNLTLGPQLGVHFRGQLNDNLGVALPSIGGLELVLGAGRIGFDADVDFDTERLSITLSADVLRLRFARSLLQPVVRKEIADPNDPTGENTIEVFEPDPDLNKKIEVVFQVAVSVDENGDIEVTWPENSPQSLTLPPAMIGDTKVVVEGNLGIDFSTTTALPEVMGRALDPAWVGIVVRDFKIYLPPDVSGIIPHQITGNCLIGSNGFSAELHGNWLDAGGDPTAVFKEVRQEDGTMKRFYEGAGSFSFFGLPGGMRSLELDIEDNIPVRSEIEAEFLLPFFDEPVAANLGIGLDGSVDLELRPAEDSSDAFVTVRKENLLELTISSLGVHRTGDVVKFGLSGEIKPLIPGAEWPSFRVDDLSIDTTGHVQLEGGWLNLRERYEVDFKGFKLEITKLGFGKNEDGGKWIGLTGGVKLVAGMPAGASVEGLRITWYDDGSAPKISINGVRIEFEVPNTLKFEGVVSWDDATQKFSGAVKLNLMALRMEVDATAVFGTTAGKPFLALYLSAEFPAGIPLFATGLGIYGAAGLFAMNMEPDRKDGQAWYSLPKGADWYHQAEEGCTDLKKWKPAIGSMAFGAGVTLGTIADNGHTFSGRMLLAIVFPGPILLLQGSANILRERATLADDANFRALAVLDGRAGTLQLGLDAKYRYDDNGNLIDINGSADGFFNFNDPNAWHLNLGVREPRDRRLNASLFRLFNSYSYVMINSQELAMGAWIGFNQNWTFGPLSVGLEAWIDANARVSWKPAHFHGDLALHGSARLAAFGFGIGVTVDAMIAADVFDPLHITGNFSVGIDLPFGRIGANVQLEWGPTPAKPPIPLPLKEVTIEHFKATSSWPLPREVRGGNPPMLLPNFDGDKNGYFKTPADDNHVPADLSKIPVVPLDSRPHITFARNINDDALVGVNAMPVTPEFERIGDPATDSGPALIRYGLKEITLEKFSEQSIKVDKFEPVAYKGPNPPVPNLPALYGSWAPVPQMPGGGGRNVGQTKLWLWSKTPFAYTRNTSRAWDEWFTDENSAYPCQTVSTEGWDFEKVPAKWNIDDPWQHPDVPGLEFTLHFDDIMSIQELERPAHGLHHALAFHGKETGTITLPEKSNRVRIMITDSRLVLASDFQGRNADGEFFPGVAGGSSDRPYVDIIGVEMTSIDYKCKKFQRATIAKGFPGGARGSVYHPELHQIVFCQWDQGTIGAIDAITGEYKVLGSGYQKPEDIVLTADLSTAYITEDEGNLLRLDFTADNLDRSQATVVTKGMKFPMQIALDEAHGRAYVVEDVEADGRLLSIDLETGNQTTIVGRLDKAFGLVLSKDRQTAYVCEIGNNGRLSQVHIETGELQPRFENLDITFFLSWEDETQESILAMQWDPDGNWVARFHIASDDTQPQVIEERWPVQFWSIVVLPNDRFVVVSDDQMTMFATSVLIPKIGDVGASVFVKHFEDEFIRWTQTGDVLEPHTTYRLRIATAVHMIGDGDMLSGLNEETPVVEYAYFRTEGPPGVSRLTAPAGAEKIGSTDKYVGALDDLSRYIRKTMPAIDAPTPLNPVSSRVFYRAYDVGVEFDENYVELMYRIGRRDLSIHMHDGNGAVRGSDGRRLILKNQWGRMEEVKLKDHEDRWLSVLVDGSCQLIPLPSIEKDSTFNATSAAHLLPASSLCEARLVPALLHDDFGDYDVKSADGPNGKLERWQVSDAFGSGNSHWTIDETTSDPGLIQTTSKISTLFYSNAPTSELAADHTDQPMNWKDYRLTVWLEFIGGKAGIVWRYRDAGHHYRFVMEAGQCELFLLNGGEPVSLARNERFTPPNDPFAITVEVNGSSMSVYQVDEKLGDVPLLSAIDETLDSGSVGFYAPGAPAAKFTDIYVDDFRSSVPVVYRFNFLSSRFKNFREQMETFENTVSVATIDSLSNAAQFVSAAKPIGDAVADPESRGFDGLLALVPGVVSSPVLKVTRVHQGNDAIAFLVQSPEPLDWTRIDLKVQRKQLIQYGDIPFKVLRKADGSGLMIVSTGSTPSGSFFQQGEYRLLFTYRRDNRTKDQNSDVLSEAGDTSPETVTLDLHWPLVPSKAIPTKTKVEEGEGQLVPVGA